MYTAVVAPLPGRGGVVGVLHDVTKQKLADRVRRDFVANASHELRTPLTAIRGFAETLKAGAAKDPDSAERFVDVILRHTLRLQALVNDLETRPQGPIELGVPDREAGAKVLDRKLPGGG